MREDACVCVCVGGGGGGGEGIARLFTAPNIVKFSSNTNTHVS